MWEGHQALALTYPVTSDKCPVPGGGGCGSGVTGRHSCPWMGVGRGMNTSRPELMLGRGQRFSKWVPGPGALAAPGTCYEWDLSGPSHSPESGSVLGGALLGFRRSLEAENPESATGHSGPEGAARGPPRAGPRPSWGVNAPPPCSRASPFAGHRGHRPTALQAAKPLLSFAMTQTPARAPARDAVKPEARGRGRGLRVTWLLKTGHWWLRPRSPPGPQSREHGATGHGHPGSAQRPEPPTQSLTSEGPPATSGPGHPSLPPASPGPGAALPSGRALGFWRPPSSISSKAKDTLWTCERTRRRFPSFPWAPLDREATWVQL